MSPTVLRIAIRLVGWSCAAAVCSPSLTATDPDALLSEARALRASGRLAESASSFESLLARVEDGRPAEAGTADLHRELGELFEAMERPRDAVAQYERSLAENPTQAVLHYRAGILLRRLAESSGAVRHLAQSVRLGFRNTGVRYHLAAAQLASGQLAEGLASARTLLRLGPRSGDLALRVGRLLFRHLFYKDALDAFEAALGLPGPSREARVYLALTNHLLNRHERSVELLSPLAAPGASADPESLTLLASAMASLDRFQEAEDLFEKAIARDPSSPHASLNLALVMLEQGKLDAADARLARMRLESAPQSPKVFYAVRRNSCEEGSREITNGDGRPAGEADAERAIQLLGFADELSARHHYGTAVEMVRLAARHATGGAPARHRLLRALAFSCLNIEPTAGTAARLLERAIELEPDRHGLHYLLGRAYRERRDTARAEAAIERAIQLKPDAAAYYSELGSMLAADRADANAVVRAGEMLVRAIELDPSGAAARFELGKLRMGQDRLAEAAEQLRGAIAAEPEFYEAHYVLGRIHARRGEPELAREHLELFESRKAASEARSTVWKEAAVQLSAE